MSGADHPLFLRMAGRRAVVVGGGRVAARRAAALVRDGADVVVVAPRVVPALRALADAGRLTWREREYRSGDLEGAWLAHTGTGVRAVDDLVAGDADAARLWCVRADAAAASSAWTPAVAHGRDGVVLAVSGAGDPRRAQRVRDRLAPLVRDPVAAGRPRRDPDGPVAPVAEPVRRGQVALVGAGPGDPGLITVRGHELLHAADVVVVDRLVPRALLDGLGDHVDVVHVGKAPGRHTLPQHAIDALLVRHGLAGRRVVRLKGGDPFVLGRGGEEALACVAAGVPVEVVPGISSAVAVPAAAGIPVTHRGVTASFVVASGHEGLGRVRDAVAAAPADATLVVLMGIARLGDLAAGLVSLGRAPDTPVALVEAGWTRQQRTTVTTLRRAQADAEAAGVANPAVVVVGDVVRLRDILGDLGRAGRAAGHVTHEGAPAVAGRRVRGVA